MKRKIILLMALAAILLAAAGGTIAYFSAQSTAVNVITAGNIGMTLHDETADGKAFPQDDLSALMPGDTAQRIVYVENTGDHALYTRIKLRCSAKAPGGSALSFEKIALDIDTANWQLGTDGWYYYGSAVEKGAQTVPLFTVVSLLPETGNDYMNADVKIEITAQAVQQANNGATAGQAAGWPAE
jgi:predicted ribosomally synthesized peptide with SipW-like signal peptide